jgi:PBSX family phage terminase large subunit
MNIGALQQQFRKIKKAYSRPAVVATLPSGPVEISPADLLDYFIVAIRLGEAPKDDKLFPILKNALPDPDQGLIFGCLRKLAQGIAPSIEDGDLFLPRDKQAKSILESTQRINLWYGSVRSSKTVMSLIKWLWRCLRGPKGRRMMVGNTSETLELNCIDPMRELLPAAVSFTTGWRHCIVFGRKVVLRGANDVGQEKKFRGPTLVDVYGDEITTWAKTIFKMILTRLSRPGAACFLTTNPDQPLHYLNTDYIERVKELSMTIWHFVLDDNPGLPEEYKADLIRENPPGTVYYLRFILGLWVAAEGQIYKTFDKAKHIIGDLPKNWSQLIVGVDYGSENPTVFLMLGMATDGPHLGKWIVWREYYYSEKKKVDTDFSTDMKVFLARGERDIWHPNSIEVDPSAASFKKQLKKDGFASVKDADNSVLDGIRNVASALTAGKLLIHESCTHLISELQNYVWDEKARERGLEAPLKQNDHAPDALRYACRRLFAKGIQ